MKNLIKSKEFISTFSLTYFLFFVVTISILDLKSDGVGIGHSEYGFPFTYYYSHCFGGYYFWSGLMGNILFAAIISFAVSLIFNFVWSKIASRRLNLK